MHRLVKIFHQQGFGCRLVTVFFLMLLFGCATTPTCPRHFEGIAAGDKASQEESLGALHSVAEAVSGQEISCEGMAGLAKDIQQNEEAASAVKEITDSLQGEGSTYKYCPVCGKRYHPKIKYCPLHNVLLKKVEE